MVGNQFVASFLETIKMSYFLNMRSQSNSGETIIWTLFFLFVTMIATDENLLERLSAFLSRVGHRKYSSVVLEGKRCFRTTDYQTRSDHLFSNRFNSVWYYIAKNIDTNSSIYSLKEFADSSNIYDEHGDSCVHYPHGRSNKHDIIKRFKDILVVNQPTKFELTENIFCKVAFSTERLDSKSKTRNTTNDVELIKLEIFSYQNTVVEIQDFLDDITYAYMTEIQNTRMNKRFIYSLVGAAKRGDDDYCNDKFEMWEECEFVSSRTFDNLFFEEKDKLVSKLRFFVDNKDWYDKEGHPHTLGLGLSGPPGTGKTSIIKCIANMLNRHLIVIPLNKVKTQREFSQYYFETRYNRNNEPNSINFDNKIIVFEDIDCMTDIVKSRDSKKTTVTSNDQLLRQLVKTVNKQSKRVNATQDLAAVENHEEELDQLEIDSDYCLLDTTPKHDKITLSFLLNIIDGLRETPGRILIITSNNYDELDKALIRPGRIDHTLRMGNASVKTLAAMFLHYYQVPLEDYLNGSNNKLKEFLVDYVLSPADIVNIRLHSDTPEHFVANMFSLLQHHRPYTGKS